MAVGVPNSLFNYVVVKHEIIRGHAGHLHLSSIPIDDPPEVIKCNVILFADHGKLHRVTEKLPDKLQLQFR